MNWFRRLLRNGTPATPTVELSTARIEMHLYREERDAATRELARWEILGSYAQDVETLRGEAGADARAWDVVAKLAELSRRTS